MDRDANQNFYIRMHLSENVPFLTNYSGETLANICKCFHQRVYAKGEIIINKGDYGNEMYIIMVGTVGVYLDNALDHCVVELSENKTYGERSLHQPEVR